MIFVHAQFRYRMISYISGLTRAEGKGPPPRDVTWMDLDIIRRPVPTTFVTIGYTNGYDIFKDPNYSSKFCAFVKPDCAVEHIKILPSSSGIRNMILVERGSESVVHFIDMTTNEPYHLIRLTSPVTKVDACLTTITIGTEKQIHLFNSESLEEIFVIPCRPVWDLSDRWLAYNVVPQQSGRSGGLKSPTSVIGKLWNKLSSISQDAFDNMVLAVTTHSSPVGEEDDPSSSSGPTMSSLQSPTKVDREARNGIIAIQDAVTLQVLGTVEDNVAGSSRPIECLKWSNSGSMLLASSGNGHSVSVYGIDFGNPLSFSLKRILNRGITPALITGLCMNTPGTISAVGSAKGTIHFFNSEGNWISKLEDKTDSDARIVFDHNHKFLVLNRAACELKKYSASADAMTLETCVESLVKRVDSNEGNIGCTLSEKPAKVEPKQSTCYPELKTCRDPPLAVWESPLIKFCRIDSATGQRQPIKFKRRTDVTVTYDTSQVSFEAMKDLLTTALNTPLETAREPDAGSKYASQPTKEGFVQLVPTDSL